MRAHLREAIAALVAAVILVVAINQLGLLGIVAGVSAAVFALSLRTLVLAFLASLEPQSRHDKRVVQRIERDIRHRMQQHQLQANPTTVARSAP